MAHLSVPLPALQNQAPQPAATAATNFVTVRAAIPQAVLNRIAPAQKTYSYLSTGTPFDPDFAAVPPKSFTELAQGIGALGPTVYNAVNATRPLVIQLLDHGTAVEVEQNFPYIVQQLLGDPHCDTILTMCLKIFVLARRPKQRRGSPSRARVDRAASRRRRASSAGRRTPAAAPNNSS